MQIIKEDIKTLQKDLVKLNNVLLMSDEAAIALDKLSWLLVSTINELEEGLSNERLKARG